MSTSIEIEFLSGDLFPEEIGLFVQLHRFDEQRLYDGGAVRLEVGVLHRSECVVRAHDERLDATLHVQERLLALHQKAQGVTAVR